LFQKDFNSFLDKNKDFYQFCHLCMPISGFSLGPSKKAKFRGGLTEKAFKNQQAGQNEFNAEPFR